MELDSNSDALHLDTRTTEVFGKHPSFRFFLPSFLSYLTTRLSRSFENERETGTVETTDALINACLTSRETITSLFPDQRGATPEKGKRNGEGGARGVTFAGN